MEIELAWLEGNDAGGGRTDQAVGLRSPAVNNWGKRIPQFVCSCRVDHSSLDLSEEFALLYSHLEEAKRTLACVFQQDRGE